MALEYGIIGVNEGIVASERAPFGVREGLPSGIDEFVRGAERQDWGLEG